MAEFRINERNLDAGKSSTMTTNVVASPVAPLLRTNPNASLAAQLSSALGAGGELFKQGVALNDTREAEANKAAQERAKLAALNANVPTNQETAQAAIPEENGVAFQRQYMYEMGRRNANDYSTKLTERVSTLDPADDVDEAVKSFTNEYTKGLNDKDYLDGFNDIAFRTQEAILSNVKANRLGKLKEIAFENLTADATQFLDLDSSNRPKTWLTDIQAKGLKSGIAPLTLEGNVWNQAAAIAVKEGRVDILQDPAWTEGSGEMAAFKDRNRDKYDLAMTQAKKALADKNQTSVSLEAYNFTNAVNFAISQAKEGLEPLATDELSQRVWGYVSTGVMKQNEGESMMKSIIDANEKFNKYERLNGNLFSGKSFTESVSADDFRGVTKLAAKKLADNGTQPEDIPRLLRQMATNQGKVLPDDLDVMTRGVNTPIGKDGKPTQYTIDAFNMFVQYRKSEHDHLLHNNLNTPDYAFMDKALTLYNQDPSKNVQAAVSTAADLIKAEKNPNLEAGYQAIKWDETLKAGMSKLKELGGKNTEGTEEYLNAYLRSNGKQLFTGYNGQISSQELGIKLAEKFAGTHVQTPTFWMDATGLPIARKDIADKGEAIEKSLRWQFAKQLDDPLWNGGKNPEDVKIVLRAAPSNIYTGSGGNYEVLIDGKATRITVDPLQIMKKHEYAKSPSGVLEYFAPIEQSILKGGYDKAKADEYRKAIELADDKGLISSKRRDQLLELNEDHDKTNQKGMFSQNILRTQARIEGNPLFKNMMAPTDNLQATSTAPYTFDSKRMPLKMVREQAVMLGRKNELALAGAAAGLGYSGVPYDFGDTQRIGFGYNLTDKEGFIKDWVAAGYAKNDKAAEAAYNGFSSGKLSLDKERAVTLHQMFQKRIGTIGAETFKDAPPHLQHAGAFAYMALKNPSEANAKKFFELVAKGDEEGAKAMFGGDKSSLGKGDLGGLNVKADSSGRDRLYELFRTMSYNPTVFQRKLETEWTNFK